MEKSARNAVMVKHISSAKARRTFDDLMNEVAREHHTMIVEQDGEPKLVMLSVKEYKELQATREQRKEAARATFNRISEEIWADHEDWTDEDQSDFEHAIDEAKAEVRAEKRRKKSLHTVK